MLRWVFLLLAVPLLALSTLTTFKSPDWSPWRLAVLAGDEGQLGQEVVALAQPLGRLGVPARPEGPLHQGLGLGGVLGSFRRDGDRGGFGRGQ